MYKFQFKTIWFWKQKNNTFKIVDLYYLSITLQMPMDNYSSVDLLLFHIGLIEELIDHMVLADPNTVEEEETKDDDFVVMDWS